MELLLLLQWLFQMPMAPMLQKNYLPVQPIMIIIGIKMKMEIGGMNMMTMGKKLINKAKSKKHTKTETENDLTSL